MTYVGAGWKSLESRDGIRTERESLRKEKGSGWTRGRDGITVSGRVRSLL